MLCLACTSHSQPLPTAPGHGEMDDRCVCVHVCMYCHSQARSDPILVSMSLPAQCFQQSTTIWWSGSAQLVKAVVAPEDDRSSYRLESHCGARREGPLPPSILAAVFSLFLQRVGMTKSSLSLFLRVCVFTCFCPCVSNLAFAGLPYTGSFQQQHGNRHSRDTTRISRN
ncbi:hypothetical protein F5Y15DRAFT_232549 [Xylariaceae sp. FL0016]|nr:hypothetical protein F5Y15DRAFT_232549 [Xylariaceae sp. FL0016]